MIDKPDNGVNTGLLGNGDPCNLAGYGSGHPQSHLAQIPCHAQMKKQSSPTGTIAFLYPMGRHEAEAGR